LGSAGQIAGVGLTASPDRSWIEDHLRVVGIGAGPATQADKVVLEVTETTLAAELDGGIAALNALRSFGARIALDDLLRGMGYGMGQGYLLARPTR
jgi:EAL domain-containing protein (putative c-di-GMP-specific phosphodiesterase class I)